MPTTTTTARPSTTMIAEHTCFECGEEFASLSEKAEHVCFGRPTRAARTAARPVARRSTSGTRRSMSTRPASIAQVGYVRRLVDAASADDLVAAGLVGDGFVNPDAMTMQQASDAIDALTSVLGADERRAVVECSAAPTSTPTRYVGETGEVHLIDGVYYRLAANPRSGRQYVQRGDVRGRSLRYSAVRPGTAARVRSMMSVASLLTAEQAAAFGHEHGSCVFCARALTDERSTSVGYGPVCAERRSLPWGNR